ncbi:hypothetical protein T02_7756 [Trichinella nativa]|uniref:Uncharacterized protein n=1 Tax=Trichinella nativa TaxID=6335 RepID=A0A0V1KUT8_9BILA|nr:hypothetical protein T02_7756 [Trichinella nativa]
MRIRTCRCPRVTRQCLQGGTCRQRPESATGTGEHCPQRRRKDRCSGQPKRRRRRWPGCRHTTSGLCTRRHPRRERDWCCHQRLMATWWRHWRARRHHGTLLPHWKRSSKEGGPWTNAPTWNHKEDRRRVHRDPATVVTPSTGSEEVDGKSGEAKNNTRAPPARSLSGRLAALSRGQKGPLLRPDLSAFARQWRARHKGGSGQTKGHGSCRSAPEIASAPAASELPIGGSRRVDRGPADLGPIYMARKRAADTYTYIHIPRSVPKTSWLRAVGFEYVVLQYWLSVLPVFRRVELGSVDEPSRSATEGRSSEGLVRLLLQI